MKEIKLLALPQLYPIAKTLAKTDLGYNSIVFEMLKAVQGLLLDKDNTISEEAVLTLTNLAKLLKVEDRGEHILTIILGMIVEQYRSCT